MPNLLTHYLFVKRFTLKVEEINRRYPNYQSFLTNNFEYLSLGTQGPDPLFYMGIIPFCGLHIPTALKKYGNKIHKLDGKKYFRFLVEQCYRIVESDNGDEERRSFQAFVFGQFAHYLLDRECHPYVLYKTGFDEDGKITGKYHYSHAHFEAQIDFCLAKKFKMDYFLTDPQDILNSHHHPLSLIDLNFVPVIKRTFNDEKLPKDMYSNGLNNMKRWLSYSNHGHAIRVAFFGKTNLSATRLPKEVKEDVLNEQRGLWLDPVTGEEHHESFMELNSKAFEILEQVYTDIIKYGFNYETFSKYIDGRNYYGTPVDQKWIYKEEDNSKK
jgi:hypothetical protein